MSFLSNLGRIPVTTGREPDRLRGDRVEAVGVQGRRLFIALKIWRYSPQPWLERFYWHTFKPVFAAALILWYTPRYAMIVRRCFGISVFEQIVQQCRLGFRDWVNPRCYYFHEHYRKTGPVDCDGYVMRHECKEGLIKVLHKLRPTIHGKRINLGHKLRFAQACIRFGLPAVPVIGIASRGRMKILDRAALQGDLFMKPEVGRGAVGARAIRRRADGSFEYGGRTVTLATLLSRVTLRSRIAPQILQPMLQNHPGLADLADRSLITIRIITCIGLADQPVVTHAMLRTLSKLEPNWPTGEEYAAPIDLTSGRMGMMCGDSMIGPLDWFEFHPITRRPVTGRVVPQWAAIRALAVAAHHAFADRMIVGWDIALTPEGPILIEGNSYPDTEFLQRVHRQPIAASPLGPLLDFHFSRLVEIGGEVRSVPSAVP